MSSYAKRVRARYPRARVRRQGQTVAIVSGGRILAEATSVGSAWRVVLAILFPQPRRRVRRVSTGDQ